MLNAIIVDDDLRTREGLLAMLGLYCPDIKVIGQAWSVQAAFELIQQERPEVVFLDIKLPDGTGFDLLKRFPDLFFKLVIISGYQDYAINAFRFNAIDYLMKPINPSELVQAVEKLTSNKDLMEHSSKLNEQISQSTGEGNKSQKILLKTNTSIEVVELDSIIRCESKSNYSQFFFNDRPSLLVSRTLKEFEKQFSEEGFLRTHQSHLVNPKFVSKFVDGADSHLVMLDDTIIPVAVRKREAVGDMLRKLNSTDSNGSI